MIRWTNLIVYRTKWGGKQNGPNAVSGPFINENSNKIRNHLIRLLPLQLMRILQGEPCS